MQQTESMLWFKFKEQNNLKSREQLIINYLPLAHSIAYKYSKEHKFEYQDIKSMSHIALILAVDSFDPTKNNNFGVYAKPCIYNGIIDEIRKENKCWRNYTLEKKRNEDETRYKFTSFALLKFFDIADDRSSKDSDLLFSVINDNLKFLSPKYKEIIEGFYLNDMSYKELESRLHTSSLEYHKRRAIKQLQQLCA